MNTDSRLGFKEALLFILLVLCGIYFRFDGLASRAYWHDEVISLMRSSGYSLNEVDATLFKDEVVRSDSFFQFVDPPPAFDFGRPIRACFSDTPLHPPLYYALLYNWRFLFGNSMYVARALSAIFSLLTIGVVGWLAWEIFNSIYSAAFASILVALSPAQLAYAHEVREYSLWTLLAALSSALLMRAIRKSNLKSYVAYTISLILAYYTFPLTILVHFAHLLHVTDLRPWRVCRYPLFLAASCITAFMYLPWIRHLLNHERDVLGSWQLSESRSLSALLLRWNDRLKEVFAWDPKGISYPINNLDFRLLLIPLVLVAFYVVWKRARIHRKTFFPIVLFATVFLPLAAYDLTVGGSLSIFMRYLLPAVLGIQLVVASLFSLLYLRNTPAGQVYLAGFFALALCWCVQFSNDRLLSTKWLSAQLRMAADEINNATGKPLLIGVRERVNVGNVAALALASKSEALFYLGRHESWKLIGEALQYDILLVLNPSEKLQGCFEQMICWMPSWLTNNDPQFQLLKFSRNGRMCKQPQSNCLS